MKESAIIIVLIVAVWLAIHFGPYIPTSHGRQPSLRSNQLPFRFSLRTFLIATTLVALILGLIIATTR
jgi:hypothetical protein